MAQPTLETRRHREVATHAKRGATSPPKLIHKRLWRIRETSAETPMVSQLFGATPLTPGIQDGSIAIPLSLAALMAVAAHTK